MLKEIAKLGLKQTIVANGNISIENKGKVVATIMSDEKTNKTFVVFDKVPVGVKLANIVAGKPAIEATNSEIIIATIKKIIK